MNSWIYLIIADIFEMGWVISLELSQNFTKINYIVLTTILMIFSIVFLSFSFKTISMGTAYACWTGIGAVGVILIGILFFNESTNFLRILFITLIVLGIIGLKLTNS